MHSNPKYGSASHLRVLHTSDWHLGRSLYGKKRLEEFGSFLTWLSGIICSSSIDVLLIAGDIFDNTAPGTPAQKLYYEFLSSITRTSCRHIVIIGGNHDSPSFLNAPRELMLALNIHVHGSVMESGDDELILLKDPEGDTELIVCAVPYLRDRDVRDSGAGESSEEKERKLKEGICAHYRQISEKALAARDIINRQVPIVVMGHLFTAGGHCVEGDGVRELYIGSLAHVDASIFPDYIDYTALGHLHVPQNVKNRDTVRYSGSPVPMGFGEAAQTKQVSIIDFTGRSPEVTSLDVPVFQKLECIRGDFHHITKRLEELRSERSSVWLEIILDSGEIIGSLKEKLDELTAGSELEILRIRNTLAVTDDVSALDSLRTLEDLNEADMFELRMKARSVPEEQQKELMDTFMEVVRSLHEEDAMALREA